MLLGYKKRFIEPIQIGTKVFTMRNKRKITPKIGETLYMYSGLRTKHTVKISDKEKLQSIQEVRIYIEKKNNVHSVFIHVDGRPLLANEISEFVKYDGFENETDFVDYWLTSSGVKKSDFMRAGGILDLFHWTDLRY